MLREGMLQDGMLKDGMLKDGPPNGRSLTGSPVGSTLNLDAPLPRVSYRDGGFDDPAGAVDSSDLPDPGDVSDPIDSRDPSDSAGPGQEAPAAPRRRGRELSPLQRALGLLVRREHSRKELSRKLTSRGIASEDAESAVSRLAEAGWQDDTRFAESLVRTRVSGGYGPLHIRAELATHGLGQEAIAAALAGFGGDWAANARDLVRRRYGQEVAQDLRLQRKAAQLLMRRGFDSACVRAATRFDPDE